MINTSARYYRIDIAINDPRQREVWWCKVTIEPDKAKALSMARRYKRARVVKVTEECVWATDGALIATGQPVE